MMLDQCRDDFQALIERIQLQAAFEKADTKDRYDTHLGKKSASLIPMCPINPIVSSIPLIPMCKT